MQLLTSLGLDLDEARDQLTLLALLLDLKCTFFLANVGLTLLKEGFGCMDLTLHIHLLVFAIFSWRLVSQGKQLALYFVNLSHNCISSTNGFNSGLSIKLKILYLERVCSELFALRICLNFHLNRVSSLQVANLLSRIAVYHWPHFGDRFGSFIKNLGLLFLGFLHLS